VTRTKSLALSSKGSFEDVSDNACFKRGARDSSRSSISSSNCSRRDSTLEKSILLNGRNRPLIETHLYVARNISNAAWAEALHNISLGRSVLCYGGYVGPFSELNGSSGAYAANGATGRE
jgi:hypothetical protein